MARNTKAESALSGICRSREPSFRRPLKRIGDPRISPTRQNFLGGADDLAVKTEGVALRLAAAIACFGDRVMVEASVRPIGAQFGFANGWFVGGVLGGSRFRFALSVIWKVQFSLRVSKPSRWWTQSRSSHSASLFHMRKNLPCIVVLLLAGTCAFAGEREQLPPGVKPVRYDLSLMPDAEKLTFSGRVRIEVAVSAPTSSIVLNEDKLTIDKALLDRNREATISVDPKLQRATLTFGAPVAVGAHTLTIDYQGAIGKSTLGFFAMDYDSPQGKRRTIATNFEPASERQFMPSWDEPGDKAVLALTVDIPVDRVAISNMPAASTKPLANGRKRVRFAPTPRMSTYLYFLGIGDFERITTKADGIEVGVAVNRGDTEKARYALGEAARILHYYNNYFGIRYPLPKLDLVLAPGQITGGSMENWGAIFYSQNHLLFDPKLSTDADQRQVFLWLRTKWPTNGSAIWSPWPGGTISGSTKVLRDGWKTRSLSIFIPNGRRTSERWGSRRVESRRTRNPPRTPLSRQF